MDPLQAWGAQVIAALQATLPALAGPLAAVSFAGSPDFFTLLIPLLYWCVDARLGLRFLFVVVAGDAVNSVCKLAFQTPRPYWVAPEVKALAVEPTFGVPSGHAASGVTAWLTVARAIRRSWVWIAAAGMILLVSFSRLYLGVHFPHDVLAGWVVGLVVLAIFWRVEPAASAWLLRQGRGARYAAAVALPAALLLLWAGAAALEETPDLPAWEAQAARAAPPAAGERAIDPRSAETVFTEAGVLLGAGLALAGAGGRGPFHAGGSIGQRGARFALGLAGLLALRFGLGAVFPEEPDAFGLALRLLRYALIGWWVVAGAPWVFLKLNLAREAAG